MYRPVLCFDQHWQQQTTDNRQQTTKIKIRAESVGAIGLIYKSCPWSLKSEVCPNGFPQFVAFHTFIPLGRVICVDTRDGGRVVLLAAILSICDSVEILSICDSVEILSICDSVETDWSIDDFAWREEVDRRQAVVDGQLLSEQVSAVRGMYRKGPESTDWI